MSEKSNPISSKAISTPALPSPSPTLVPSPNPNPTPSSIVQQHDLTPKDTDPLTTFSTLSLRAQTMLWSWESKFATAMLANALHEANLLQGMSIIIGERDKTIAELRKREKAQAEVVKNLERKIRQMRRASVEQEGLIGNFAREVERRDGVIEGLERKR